MYRKTSGGTYPDPLYLPDKDSASYRFTGAIIVRITYGYELQEKEDPMIALAESTVASFASFNKPGAYLVDSIPLCGSISYSYYQFEYSPTAQ